MRDTQSNTADPLLEALTRREREILALLDEGLSAPEIAQRLTLAVSSVKWHIGQLYGKLGVSRRHQALLRARALGLLAAPTPAPASPAPRHNHRGDYLFEAPLSFYSATESWALSPGYARSAFEFDRPILSACTYCHSERAEAVRNGNGLYLDPPFRELAIGCEKCHGPGRLHVEERLKAAPLKGEIDDSIVNPAKLPSWLADNICMGCHEFGHARVLLPGKSLDDFRPGTPLGKTVAIFKVGATSEKSRETALLEYYSSMILSECFRASGGRLSCLVCHDPHTAPSAEEAPAYFRSRCLDCHKESSCRLDPPKRQSTSPADNCVACHMPQHNAQGFTHAMVTSHRIVRVESEPYPETASDAATTDRTGLILLDQVPGQDASSLSPLVLLQAYKDVLTKFPGESAYKQRYDELLDWLAKSQPDDKLVLSSLAQRELAEKTPEASEKATGYLRKAVVSGSTSPSDYLLLAELLMRSRQAGEAIQVLRKAMALVPYDPLPYQNLTVGYWFTGNFDECVESARKGLKLFPEDAVEQAVLQKCQARSAAPLRVSH